MTAADVNHDGFMDLIVGNAGESSQLLLNQGNGSFSNPIDLPDGALQIQITMGCWISLKAITMQPILKSSLALYFLS
jgi:hypothetical protein